MPRGKFKGSNRDLLAELRELIGDANALRLIEAFGGCEVYMATGGGDRTVVAQACGPDAADRLARFYGGSTLTVPLAKEWRAHTYYDHFKHTSRAIALKLTMTRSGVSRVLSRPIDALPFDPERQGADPL